MPSDVRENVPGALLRGRRPDQLKMAELKLCRGAPTKGKKADLVERYGCIYYVRIYLCFVFFRVNAYIKFGWDKNIIDPHTDRSVTHPGAATQSTEQYVFPTGGWRFLTNVYSNVDECPVSTTVILWPILLQDRL